MRSWRGHEPWSARALQQYRDPDDAALVRQARAGDALAFAALLGRHERRLRALRWRLLGDSGVTEEVMQQTAVEALVGLPRLASPERFGAWLLAIAANLCRRQLRSPARRLASLEALLAVGALAEPRSGESGPVREVETRELATTVRGALAGLPPGQRRALDSSIWTG